MTDEEMAPLRASLKAYDNAAWEAEKVRLRLIEMTDALESDAGVAHDVLKSMHEQLLETVRYTELSAAMARGVLGVVAAMRGLSEPAKPYAPYTPPEGEDYIGT